MASHKFSKASVDIRKSGGEITATADGWAFFSACGHKLVAHKTMPAGKYWQVTEPVTGHRIGSGSVSRDAAADLAERILARHPGALAQCITQTLIEREVATERAA